MAIDFRVIFVPGKKNTLPDGLSRFPILGPSIYDVEEVPALTVTESKTVGDRPVHLTASEGKALVEILDKGIDIQVLAAMQQAGPSRRSARER
jgi:hypothetical protein